MGTKTERLGHDDPRLAEAIRAQGLPAGLYHTGGQVYVLEVALDGSDGADGFDTKATGVVLWLTRSDDEWIAALYDYSKSDDEGVPVTPTGLYNPDDPNSVAAWVVGFIQRVSAITSRRETLVFEDDVSEGTGPLWIADSPAEQFDRETTPMERIGDTSVTFDAMQAVAISKAIRLPLRRV